MSPLNVAAADENRDALAKMVYSRMFDWLVEKINVAIGQDPKAVALVGVLDIYGRISLLLLLWLLLLILLLFFLLLLSPRAISLVVKQYLSMLYYNRLHN